ncbi:unnamed protein product [Adineta steineri]|uniref:Uncharacterized protein n=1 Tax=Adineta steineri TaxID=433720 RepID=A0A820JEN1_9BILA|nr:unnamed protein product [Adineta steineri]
MFTLKLCGDVGEHFFERNKQILNRSLNDLIEETKLQTTMLGNNPEVDRIKLIVENLKRIQKAKQFILEYMNASNELSESVDQIILMIEHRLNRFVDEIKAFMYINNFYEAEQKIVLINLLRILLGSFCTKQISDEIELIKEYRKKIVSDEIIQKYLDMNIDGYILNPPIDIFEKLEQVRNINTIYTEAIYELRKNIIDKFRQELELAKSVIPLNTSSIHIRKFESSVKYLPETIRNVLEVELKHCREDINLTIQNINN